MKIKALALVFACAALVFVGAVGVSFGLLGIPTASAITWNFNLPPGADGTSQGYNSTPPSGFLLTAAGFSSAAQLATGVPNVNLFGKSDGGGAGLPGLVVACGALIALARRRRQRIA